ncbi:hypothetical protein IMSHALPRED_001651 [Imshaugia aleurites]|uniref:S-adenosyl-L-methionine-dependent methyltransferase n=1 Tax=Imshaugia aleurites TaxID=172621 RepID=A0A8H3J351_9LECA|nr:hypothetical protein IMSHALPRED_001651 [Imshaugia aleurites]
MAPPTAQRSFHNTETEYHLQNDAPEHARLESQAAALADLMHNHVIHAPLRNPQRLLDVGCGTGAVTHPLSTTYPSASHIYGIDLSPVPAIRRPAPPLPFHTPNTEHIQGDIKQLATTDPRLRPNTFDFVFSRLLICGMTDWAAYIRDTAVPLLKPGVGWLEIQDLDYVFTKHGRVCSGDEEWAWMRAMERGARRKGLDLHCGSNAARYLRDAGLVDV